MKRSIKLKWLEALRSGKYRQTTGYLSCAGGHCCLGVLCEIGGLKSEPASFHIGADAPRVYSYQYPAGESEADSETYGKSARVLPQGYVNALGLGEPDPRVAIPAESDILADERLCDSFAEIIRDTGGIRLSALNDSGFTFTEIADLIEKHIPEEEG